MIWSALAGNRKRVLREPGEAVASFTEHSVFDYENELGVAVSCIFGMKKTVYDDEDFGTIVIATNASAG